jgi:hypothetical protein
MVFESIKHNNARVQEGSPAKEPTRRRPHMTRFDYFKYLAVTGLIAFAIFRSFSGGVASKQEQSLRVTGIIPLDATRSVSVVLQGTQSRLVLDPRVKWKPLI